jgi:glycosyltransferase involved in cell wall biosynthesis
MNNINVSIVVPLYNEVESLPELHSWIVKVVNEQKLSYEIIFVDDGSKDGSWAEVERLKSIDPNVHGIKFQRNYGKSAALQKGFELVQGDVVITMDADLQDSPDEIPELYRMVVENDFDVVSGWKQKRFDPITKTLPTKLYNWAARRITGIKLNDFNCGLKAYKKIVVKSIELYGDMHRYIPALAKYAGYTNIGEKVVQHQSRKYGVTKFGLNRFINGPLDLLTVAFMGKFGKKPMHFFGSIGLLLFFVGFVITSFLMIDKLFIDTTGRLLTSRPQFFFALVCMILGTQFFLAGFIGEMVGRNASQRNSYLIDKTI